MFPLFMQQDFEKFSVNKSSYTYKARIPWSCKLAWYKVKIDYWERILESY